VLARYCSSQEIQLNMEKENHREENSPTEQWKSCSAIPWARYVLKLYIKKPSSALTPGWVIVCPAGPASTPHHLPPEPNSFRGAVAEKEKPASNLLSTLGTEARQRLRGAGSHLRKNSKKARWKTLTQNRPSALGLRSVSHL